MRRYGGENSAGTRPEELNVAPYSGVIKCETDVWGSEDICQAHNVLGSEDICQPHDEFRRSATLGVESDVHQGSEHDPHSNVLVKCGTDVERKKQENTAEKKCHDDRL